MRHVFGSPPQCSAVITDLTDVARMCACGHDPGGRERERERNSEREKEIQRVREKAEE